MSALAFCSAFGFRTVGIDLDDRRRTIAAEMGADLVVDPSDPGMQERVVAFLDGRGADLVLETASVWTAVETALDVVRQDGTVVVVARHVDSPAFNPVGHPYMSKRFSLRASLGYRPNDARWNRTNSMELTARLLAEGKLNIDPMITHEFRWNELPEVYAHLDRGDRDILGAVIRWQ